MFEEDLSLFFDASDFGTSARWRAGGAGAGVDVVGIFDNGFASPSLGALSSVDREIVFRCAASDVPGVARGDTLKVGDVTYRVVEPRPDGTGVVILVLKATA